MGRKLWTALMVMLIPVAAVCQLAPGRTGPRPELWKDDDMADVSEPARRRETLHYDFFYATFGQAPLSFVSRLGSHQPAWNVNAWEEVPDSSWYTNRHHLRPMTVEQIRAGANRGPGPDLSGRLVVLEGKTAGTSVGFGRTKDAAGNTYFIKFDSSEYPELTTAAEIIASRFFYAMGFNVPEEWLISIRPEQIEVNPDAEIWGADGRLRKMTTADLADVLKRAARQPDGRYRAVASLLIPGKIRGGFRFHGTREDDPNDLIPHHHRRELRGLRLLCAWLSHYDIRVGNTMDVYVEEDGRKFMRHYLLDFGSALGSASYFPKVPRMGFSYVWDTREASGPFLTLGIYQPRWREHPAPVEFPSVGRFESAMFSPARWKPVLPLVSFDYMDSADAFWAGKIVMSFTEEQVRAAVREGRLSDPRSEETLVRILLARQRKVGEFALSQASPLDSFTISNTTGGERLEFRDLAVDYGFASAASSWYSYTFGVLGSDNSLAGPRSARGPRIPLEELAVLARQAPASSSLFVLALRTHRAEARLKGKPLRVYLERGNRGFRVRGWERPS